KQSRGYVNPIFGSDSGLSYRAYKPAVKRAKKSRGDGNRPRPGLKPHALRGAAARPTGGLSWQRLGAGLEKAKIIGHSGIISSCIGDMAFNEPDVCGLVRMDPHARSCQVDDEDMAPFSLPLIGSNCFTTMFVSWGDGAVSLQSAPEPTQKVSLLADPYSSLTGLGSENHEETPPLPRILCQTSYKTLHRPGGREGRLPPGGKSLADDMT
ncbi:hypothetical protein B296_00035378, partial [Ensete ventricosum]